MTQQQESNDFHINSYGGNMDEITHRLNQMNVETGCMSQEQQQQQQQQPCVNISFQESSGRCQFENTNDHMRMSVDDDELDNRNEDCHQKRTTKRAESNILIVTNVDPNVFSDSLVKAKFESLFTVYDEKVLFRYLKSFRRVRLDFSSARQAEAARLNLNNYKLGNTTFKCYLAQMIRPNGRGNDYGNSSSSNNNNNGIGNRNNFDFGDGYNDDSGDTLMDNSDQQEQNNFYLSIPKPSKQFLISPPVSPPEGWKPHEESTPCIDVQLISAIANMVPGQVHEIHPGNESQPGIYVEVCEENDYDSSTSNSRTRIPKTANPIATARAAIGHAMKLS
jgi:hypothetical protein